MRFIDDSFLNANVKVYFNIKGNKWERDGNVKYFTNLDALENRNLDQPLTTTDPGKQLCRSLSSLHKRWGGLDSDGEMDDLPF